MNLNNALQIVLELATDNALELNEHGDEALNREAVKHEEAIEKVGSSELLKAVTMIDWPLLREQKAIFLTCMDVMPAWLEMHNGGLEGILALLDAIQDAAVSDGIVSESIVFNSGE